MVGQWDGALKQAADESDTSLLTDLCFENRPDQGKRRNGGVGGGMEAYLLMLLFKRNLAALILHISNVDAQMSPSCL